MNFINRFFEKYTDKQLIKWFKKACIYEAWSCFLLYLIAMPLKRYFPDDHFALITIIIAGNIHGLFFTIYLLLTLPAKRIFNWDDEDFVFALLSAFFPFATIWVDKKLAKFDRK